MRGNGDIRWRDSDKQKLSYFVQQFNRKITEIEKKRPDLAEYLPDRVSSKDVTKRIRTREDFDREIMSLASWQAKDAATPIQGSQGVKTTKWELNDKMIRVEIGNARQRREREIAEKMDVTIGGKPLKQKRGTMGSMRMHEFDDRKINIDSLRGNDWKRFVRSIENFSSGRYSEKKAQLYKNNFLEAIDNTFGGLRGVGKLRALIERFTAEQMATLYMMEQVYSTFDFVYEGVGEDSITSDKRFRLDKLIKFWSKTADDLIKMQSTDSPTVMG